jgi:hypothetical protein
MVLPPAPPPVVVSSVYDSEGGSHYQRLPERSSLVKSNTNDSSVSAVPRALRPLPTPTLTRSADPEADNSASSKGNLPTTRARTAQTMTRGQAFRLKNQIEDANEDCHLEALSLEASKQRTTHHSHVPSGVRAGGNGNDDNNANTESTIHSATASPNYTHKPTARSPSPQPLGPNQVRDEKRRLIVEEILATEDSYVETLQKVIRVSVCVCV